MASVMTRSTQLPGLVLGALAAICALVGPAGTLRAQVAPLSVLANPSARSIAMGETGGADASDPTNAYLNPAVLGNGAGVYLMIFYDQLLGDLTDDVRLKGFYTGGGYVFPVGSGVELGLAGQLRYSVVTYGDVTLPLGPSGGSGTINPSDRYVGLALVGDVRIAQKFTIGVGVTLKDWQIDSDIPNEDVVDGNTVDAGLRLAYTSPRTETGWQTTVALAASVWNLNGEYQYAGYNLDFSHDANYALSVRTDGPTRLLGGTGAYVPKLSFVFNVDVTVPERGPNDEIVGRLGAEFAAMQVLFARLGWEIPENSDISVLLIGFGLGMPSQYFDVRIDFTATPLKVFGSDVDINDRDQKASVSVNVPFPLGSNAKAPHDVLH